MDGARGHKFYPKDGTGWEKFQWTNNAWWTGAAAGFLWTIPCLFLGWFINSDWFLVSLVSTLSVPLAGITSRKLFDEEDRWLAAEGLLAGFAMILLHISLTLKDLING